MFKRTIKLFLIIIVLFLLVVPTLAQETSSYKTKEENINVYFFWAYGCPHCSDEKPFLEKMEQKYHKLKIESFEVSNSKKNIDLLKQIGEELTVDVSGVPFTVIGEQYFIGWYNEQTTGREIERAIQCVVENSCVDVVGGLISPITVSTGSLEQGEVPHQIKLPILGEIETKNFSLPILTIIIGALDGFNPCAMWVLLFLITLLLGMKDRKKMWILGTVFIIISALVYFIFMSAWLNLLLFLGFIFWVRIIIGMVALVTGGYNLKEYFTNPLSTCKVTGGKRKRLIFEKLKEIIQKKQFWLALLGIILLAFAVNLVELICSAGLPAIYTQILTLTHLTKWQYYLYLLLYIFVFMLDDLIIFSIAMITLRFTGISNKYSRISHLIGGIIMLIIGILLIIRPEWLMFG